MTFIGALIALIGLIATLYGLFLAVFRKGRRKRGWFIGAIALFVVTPIGVGLVDIESDSTKTEGKLVANAQDQSSEPPQPTTATQPPTQNKLNRPEALTAYCEGLVHNRQMIAEADARFSDPSSDEHYNWMQEQEALISQATTDAIGVPAVEWASFAYDHNWNHRCDAITKGWQQVELTDIKAAARKDRNRVRDAIELNFIQRLKANEGNYYFDKETFKAVSCSYKTFGDVNILGCKMLGALLGPIKHSGTLFFTAASINDTSIAVPLDSTAEELSARQNLHDVDAKSIPTGKYIGPYPMPDIDWAEVKRYFER